MDEHSPVLVEEALAALAVRPDGFYVDATFGRGGHTARILAALGPAGRVLALDRDAQAIGAGRERFAAESRLVLVHGAFGELAHWVHTHGARAQCDGVLFDLGVSSPQLGIAARGFSFLRDGPLDMRMDPSHGQPVSTWLHQASPDEIRDVIAKLGEERFARRIASRIVQARVTAPLLRTSELAELVARAVPTREPGKHPATRTFQALRMWINDELGQLERGLDQALALLAPGGRLAVISFHSLEDRLVKQFIRRHSEEDPAFAHLPIAPPQAQSQLARVGRKVRAGAIELAANPRARSAILRVAERRSAAGAGARSA